MAESEVLEPMEVSALRLETDSSNLPARIQFIGEAEIRHSGAMDLAELLRREANLQVRSTSGNSARSVVSMGGFGENSGLRTLVLLDGHRLNAIDQSVLNWYSIPVSLVESVEVIRGGQAGTFGNHAVGGVIKINTKLPEKDSSGFMEVSGGSFDSFHARGSYTQRLGMFGLTIFGERAESDGYRINGDHHTDAGGVRLDWGKESDLRGYVSWSMSDTDFGLPGDLNASAVAFDPRQSNDPNDRGRESSDNGRFGLSYDFNQEWTWENRFGKQDRVVEVTMPSATWIADTEYETFSYSPILHFDQDDADWVFGIDYLTDEVNSDTNFDDSILERSSLALFVSTRQDFAESWNWTGNFRIEKMENSGVYAGTVLNPVEDNQWAGEIGLVRQLEAVDRMYGVMRRYYRYPAIDEILLAWPPPSSLNANLRPENGYELEFGMDWSFNSLFLNSRIFRQWMEDEIIYVPWSNRNLEKSRRLGFELSLDWQMTEALRTGFLYEYVRATIEAEDFAGSKIPLVPEVLLRLFLELNPIDSLRIKAGGSYVGESFRGSDFLNNQLKMEDYWLYDLSVNYDFSDRATLFGGIDNLFDEKYLSTAFGTGLYPGEGRKATIGLRYSF